MLVHLVMFISIVRMHGLPHQRPFSMRIKVWQYQHDVSQYRSCAKSCACTCAESDGFDTPISCDFESLQVDGGRTKVQMEHRRLYRKHRGWPVRVARIAQLEQPFATYPDEKNCRRKLTTASAQRIASRAAQASCQRALEFGVKATLACSLKISTVLTYHGLLCVYGHMTLKGDMDMDFLQVFSIAILSSLTKNEPQVSCVLSSYTLTRYSRALLAWERHSVRFMICFSGQLAVVSHHHDI